MKPDRSRETSALNTRLEDVPPAHAQCVRNTPEMERQEGRPKQAWPRAKCVRQAGSWRPSKVVLMKTSIGQHPFAGNDEEPCNTARRTTFSAVAADADELSGG